MTVCEMAERLALTPLAIGDENREFSGVYIGDLLSWVMGRASSDNVWITIMSNVNVVAVATLADVACIILAEGVTLDENVRATAEKKGVNVFTSEKTAYELAALLAQIEQ
ncbi:MAG: hypothetical protein E7643_00595 [Ruminococcaceae bacterium]|nr:hypothetical protein [Oscillospiraceae bacterium]